MPSESICFPTLDTSCFGMKLFILTYLFVYLLFISASVYVVNHVVEETWIVVGQWFSKWCPGTPRDP